MCEAGTAFVPAAGPVTLPLPHLPRAGLHEQLALGRAPAPGPQAIGDTAGKGVTGMEDVGKHTNGIEEFRGKVREVAARVIEDALKAPTARERTQAARLVFDVLGFLGG